MKACRGPFPHRDLRELQRLGVEAFRAFLDSAWRPDQRDRRNLTPDQLALVMGRHYNRTKHQGGKAWRNGRPGQHHQNDAGGHGEVRGRLAADYGVATATIDRAGRFAAAVETLKAEVAR